jgi:hypothetical protein
LARGSGRGEAAAGVDEGAVGHPHGEEEAAGAGGGVDGGAAGVAGAGGEDDGGEGGGLRRKASCVAASKLWRSMGGRRWVEFGTREGENRTASSWQATPASP